LSDPKLKKARPLKCKDCGKVLEKHERKIRVDPFMDEIKNVIVKGRWCDFCMKQMEDDI